MKHSVNQNEKIQALFMFKCSLINLYTILQKDKVKANVIKSFWTLYLVCN